MSALKVTYLLGLLLLVASCDKTRVFEDYIELGSTWHKDSLATFQFEIKDTSNYYDLNINVRNMGNYPYSNLWLFVDIIEPDSTIIRDTVEYELAQSDGKWLGNGIGDLFDCKWRFKENVAFKTPGIYAVKIQQAMRMEQLTGIHDIGFRVEVVSE